MFRPADEHFEGADNDLVEQRTLTVRSACQFDLSMYPFDVQACRVVVRSVLGVRSLTLLSEGVHFLVSGGAKNHILKHLTGFERFYLVEVTQVLWFQ